MALPLPPIYPGGDFLASQAAANAVSKSELENHAQRLKNQYYAPNIESEIAQRRALTEGQTIHNKYLPEEYRLANALNQQKFEWNPRNWQSENAERNALTNKYNTMTPLEAQELRLKNQFYPELTKSNIEAQKSLSNYRAMGGGGMGTGSKEEFIFQNLISKDNPQLNNDPVKVYEASNVLRSGGDTLSDGTKLNPLSPASQTSFDRLVKGSSYSGAIVPLIKARGAEAEIDTLNKYAQKGLEPYGTTYLGRSPQQIFDSASNDIKDKKKLGRLLASQAIQYEIAQNRIRLANGQPGVTSTEELMRLSGQQMHPLMPKLDYETRKEASRYLDEALKAGLEARRKVGVGASSASSFGQKEKRSDKTNTKWVYNQETGQLEPK